MKKIGIYFFHFPVAGRSEKKNLVQKFGIGLLPKLNCKRGYCIVT